MSRARVCFLAWAPTAGRARDLAHDLGGDALTIYPASLSSRRLTPARYAVSALVTLGGLTSRRPRSVVVQNPPVYPALIALAYARLTRGRMVLDNHPTSFGVKDNAQARRMLAVTRWLVRSVDGVLVTTEDWADVVRSWGGRPLVLHEAPPVWSVSAPRRLDGRPPRVLFSCVYASDEPVEAVIAAARALPELEIVITGDERKAPPGLLDELPPNVVTTGWLDQAAYAAEIERCDIVLALTTEPSSVMRAAYEAGYAARVLVMSDTEAMARLFPEAVRVGIDSAGIAAGLRRAVEEHDRLLTTLAEVRERQHRRWDLQRADLLELLGLGPTPHDLPTRSSADDVVIAMGATATSEPKVAL